MKAEDHTSEIQAAFSEANRMRPVEHAARFPSALDDLALATQVGEATTFPIPVTDLGPTRPFSETIAARYSIRELTPPTLQDVALVMARCGLTHNSGYDLAGARIDHRPAPSAGGRHPLSLVLLSRWVIGLAAGAWVLDPDAAVLRPAAYGSADVAAAFAAVAMALHLTEPPPAAIFTVAHPDRTLTRYPDGISLLWRETGALLMLVHLVATDIGLGSCIAGTCGVLHQVPHSTRHPIDLGAVALGGVPEPDGLLFADESA